MRAYLDAIANAELVRRTGEVIAVAGHSVEAVGPQAVIGEICEIGADGSGAVLPAEVVGVKPGRVVLMPYGDLRGASRGSRVVATGRMQQVEVGEGLLGRVVDGFGVPLDGKSAPAGLKPRALFSAPVNPLQRPRVDRILETGIRAIDALMPIGLGQRVGIFAGSGVGKSTLLGMLARNVRTEISVIALVGERGREVREFVEKHLAGGALSRSVVVVATSDQPALVRVRAVHAATAIAEHFRDAGRHVLLMMDSVTRFAMARREIGLAAGEPPTARGYTPSVFADIPPLCERCGTGASGGSVTALYTVLVEGDDFNEPVSDLMRATLDGHIMLTRDLAHQGHFPAIDVLQSASRLAGDLSTPEEQGMAASAIESLALYEKNRQMVDMGAYRAGSNAALDRAIENHAALRAVLRQSVHETCRRPDAMRMLAAALMGKR